VVIFDQRGAGRSRPLGELRDNTTPHLVSDIETLRRFLGIERWLLFGGSWGSTLALAYAQAHPDRVAGCVLRGVFLGRQRRGEWFLYGLRRVFPDAWAALRRARPARPSATTCCGLSAPPLRPGPDRAPASGPRLEPLRGLLLHPAAEPETVASFAQDRTALGLARIEAHYFANDLFLRADGLLEGMRDIAHIPAEIVQGRYDMVCPCDTPSTWRPPGRARG
jgi:proline iminopeptidase